MNAGAARFVLVTGGTRRLGSAIAGRLRADGWRVITSSSRPGAGADIVADLSADGAADGLYKAAQALAGGRLGAIVNNAALFRAPAQALRNVNLRAPSELMQFAMEDGLRVVNILDTRVLNSGATALDAYGESKALLRDATMLFARKSTPSFRVNAVAPGPVLAPEGVHEKAGRLLAARPTPEDVAAAVAFLLDTPSVTGVILPVDAGQHLLKG